MLYLSPSETLTLKCNEYFQSGQFWTQQPVQQQQQQLQQLQQPAAAVCPEHGRP